MKLLALDLGTTIGWAVGHRQFDLVEEPRIDKYGQHKFPSERSERFHHFHQFLTTLETRRFTTVIYERPFTRGLGATRSLWGMAGIVEMWAHSRGLPCLDIVPTTIKKWATGNGRASKEEMIVAAAKKLAMTYLNPRDLKEHEADAILLGLFALTKIEVIP